MGLTQILGAPLGIPQHKKAINLVDGAIFKMVGSKPTNLAMLNPFMPKLELLDDFFVNSTTHMRKKSHKFELDGTIFQMVGPKPTNLAMPDPFMPKLERLNDFFLE